MPRRRTGTTTVRERRPTFPARSVTSTSSRGRRLRRDCSSSFAKPSSGPRRNVVVRPAGSSRTSTTDSWPCREMTRTRASHASEHVTGMRNDTRPLRVSLVRAGSRVSIAGGVVSGDGVGLSRAARNRSPPTRGRSSDHAARSVPSGATSNSGENASRVTADSGAAGVHSPPGRPDAANARPPTTSGARQATAARTPSRPPAMSVSR